MKLFIFAIVAICLSITAIDSSTLFAVALDSSSKANLPKRKPDPPAYKPSDLENSCQKQFEICMGIGEEGSLPAGTYGCQQRAVDALSICIENYCAPRGFPEGCGAYCNDTAYRQTYESCRKSCLDAKKACLQVSSN